MTTKTILRAAALTLALAAVHSAYADGAAKTPQCAVTYNTQFAATQEVAIAQAKVAIAVDATLNPGDLAAFLTQLGSFKDTRGNTLVLKRITQTRTDSGMINVNGLLEDTLPLGDTAVAYQFAAQHDVPGVSYKVAGVAPYLSPSAASAAQHTVELQVFQQAQAFAKQLSQASGLPFTVQTFNAYSGADQPGPLVMTSFVEGANSAGGAGAMAVDRTVQVRANVTYCSSPA